MVGLEVFAGEVADGAGPPVEVAADGSGFGLAMAFSSAATVAASTAPVGLTPNSVWNSFSASVSAGVQVPSTGPSQNPASLSVCWTAAVEAIASCAAAPPLASGPPAGPRRWPCPRFR